MYRFKNSLVFLTAHRSHRRLTLVLGSMILGMLALIWNVLPASADSLSCGISELTFTSGGPVTNAFPRISGDAKWISFESNRDLTGNNADGNVEIFLYDTMTGAFTQITNTTAGINVAASINADGTRIAFSSSSDLTGENSDHNQEIFLYDTTTATFTQITKTTGGISFAPSINADGTRIAFSSSSEVIPGVNPDGNQEMFLYDTSAPVFIQITNTTLGNNGSASINADGTLVAFISDCDLTGGNADRNREIFLFDTTSLFKTQVTNTTSGFNDSPSINADGTRIAFDSTAFPGGNPDGNDEIFLFDATTSGISELTFTTNGTNHRPSISRDGTRIAFVSNKDFAGENADANDEVFLYDTTTNSFTQVTSTLGISSASIQLSISGDGTKIAFSSNRFADLGNADGNDEIFLASCVLPPPPAQADLLLSQSADKSSVKQGDTLTYTVTVKNLGPDNATSVVINDTLSSGATFVSAHANKGSFTAPPVGQTGTLTWDLGTVSNGEEDAAQIQVTVIIRGKTTVTNTATVNSDARDPNPANNNTSLSTTVQAGGGKK